MKISELTEGLAGRQKKEQRERTLKGAVAPLVNALIDQRRAEYTAIENSPEQRRHLKSDVFQAGWTDDGNPLGFPSVEEYLKAFDDADFENFEAYIEPFLNEIKKAIFAEYQRYTSTLDG
jgi:hypothetical protein